MAIRVHKVLYALLLLVQAILPTAVMALATAHFVDTAMAVLQGYQPRGDIYLPLALLLLVLVGITSLGSVAQLVSARINFFLEREMKPDMVKAQAGLEYKHVESAESWELITRVTADPVGSVMRGYNGYLAFAQVLLSVVSVMGLILAQVWWAALVIVAFSVPLFWLSMRAGRQNYQAMREAEQFNRRTAYLENVLTDRATSEERTLFGYGGDVTARWFAQYEAGRILQLRVWVKNFIISGGTRIVVAVIGLLTALTLINPVAGGQLSAGMYMGLVAAVFSLWERLGGQLNYAIQDIAQYKEYRKDMAAFYALSKADGACAEPDPVPMSPESIEFRGVRFKYPNGEDYILNGLSFTLDAGRQYAFVGSNGAGKTTIIKLLTGLYTDYEGEILLNGKELRTYPAGALKALFSVVYQDHARYFITLGENIALGDIAQMPDPADAARQMGLDENLHNPLGRIFDDGVDLSGGQWQRVAIARSLVSRAPIKILDEPTAALDPISETKIYHEFENLMAGKTTIFISHRLGSTKLAHDILVIEGGRLIERGTHDALLGAAGVYHAMYESQRSWYQ